MHCNTPDLRIYQDRRYISHDCFRMTFLRDSKLENYVYDFITGVLTGDDSSHCHEFVILLATYLDEV